MYENLLNNQAWSHFQTFAAPRPPKVQLNWTWITIGIYSDPGLSSGGTIVACLKGSSTKLLTSAQCQSSAEFLDLAVASDITAAFFIWVVRQHIHSNQFVRLLRGQDAARLRRQETRRLSRSKMSFSFWKPLIQVFGEGAGPRCTAVSSMHGPVWDFHNLHFYFSFT